MANSNITMTTQLYSDQVLKGFVDYLAPLSIFSLDASPSPVERGVSVTVPFIVSGSTAADWAEATGYASQVNSRQGKTVTINKHKFVYSGLTDTEIANSSITNLQQMAYNQGASLATAVLTDIFTAFTGSNFSSTGLTLASASLMTVDGLVDLRAAVSLLKWPEAGRNVIITSYAMKGLLKDDDLKYIYRGTNDVVTSANITNVFGWNGIYENNLLPTTGEAGNDLIGVAVNPDALIIANRYLAPSAGHKYSQAVPLTDPKSGLTIGVRSWYDENYGSTRTVWECSYGYTVGNPNAATKLTATDGAL